MGINDKLNNYFHKSCIHYNTSYICIFILEISNYKGLRYNLKTINLPNVVGKYSTINFNYSTFVQVFANYTYQSLYVVNKLPQYSLTPLNGSIAYS